MAAAAGLFILTGCEGGDLYNVDSPDWISARVDSIKAANSASGDTEIDLLPQNEDVYTVGATDYSNGFWQAFSKYYVIPDGEKFQAQFNLHPNPDNVYYKNCVVIVANDVDRGGEGYQEYGAWRYDFTNDSVTYNSQWGNYLWFKYSASNMPMSPVDNVSEISEKMAGLVTLTVDRSKVDTFYMELNNGVVKKTYIQPYVLPNINPNQENTNIRIFVVVDGSYLEWESASSEPIGGYTSALDKQPISMELQNVPDEVGLGSDLDSVMANVTALVTYEEGVTKVVTAEDLNFTSVPDTETEGEKLLIATYNKTFKGENADKAITATATFKVVLEIIGIEITAKPAHTTYYFLSTDATSDLTDRTLAFDPTGMEVTVTYADNTKAVIDNAKLVLPTVKAEVGTQTLVIATQNGNTTNVDITVAESETVAVTYETKELGAADNSTGWWSAFSPDIKVEPGKTAVANFTNYSGGANWNNYVVILRNAALAEYAVVRSDNYGWGNGYAAARLGRDASDILDPSWLAAMNGAHVTVYVTNCNNGTVDVQAEVDSADGNFYFQYYLGINTVDVNDFYYAFTVDGSHLVFD